MAKREVFTEAEKACRKAGFCVFALCADRCSICGRDRNGKRVPRG